MTLVISIGDLSVVYANVSMIVRGCRLSMVHAPDPPLAVPVSVKAPATATIASQDRQASGEPFARRSATRRPLTVMLGS